MANNKYPWEQWYNDKQMKIDYPQGSCYDSLLATSNDYPNYKAYNYYGKEVEYKELVNDVDNVAKSLKEIGVKEGDYITICSSNVPEAIIALYAVNKIGAIANMVHPKTSIEELKFFLDLTKSKIVIGLDVVVYPFLKELEKTKIEKIVLFNVYTSISASRTINQKIDIKSDKIEVIEWEKFYMLSKIAENTESIGKKEDICVVLYSGGTTGKPKGVMISNYNLNALAYEGWFANNSLEPGDSMLAVMPIFHGFGLGICIHTSFCFGLKAVIQPKLDVQNFDQLLIDYKPNMVAGVPSIYEYLLKSQKLDNADLSFLKGVSSGGDSLTISMKNKINKFLKDRGSKVGVKEGYGLTECVTGTCLMPKDIDKDGSVGIPYTDTIYKIVEPNTFNELKYGEVGEIVISAPTIMVGYLGNEEETNKALRKDKNGITWFYTGDLGLIDEDGFVYYKGRIKRMIISSGYNIYPDQIEEIIEKNPKVLASSVVGIPDEMKGEIPVAFVVLKGADNEDMIMNDIKKYVTENVSKYAIPKEYFIIDNIPKTPVGKVDYKALVTFFFTKK